MSNKKYRLLKDLPDVLAGAVFELGKGLDAYYLTSDKTITRYNCYCYPKEWVENKPDWFSEVKSDRIEVKDLHRYGGYSGGPEVLYKFTLSREVDSLPLIKSAIEFVLNNEPNDVDIGGYTFKFLQVPTDKKYSQEQYDKAIEDAFNAARLERPLPFNHTVYKSAKDYLNHINKQKTIIP